MDTPTTTSYGRQEQKIDTQVRAKASEAKTDASCMYTDEQARSVLRKIFDAAVASANPARAVNRHLPEKPKGRCIVIGAGKASAAMAAALDQAWPDVDLSGFVVTRYGHAVRAGRIRIMEAAHPIPDDNSETAARQILAAVGGLTADDLVIAMMSGGGSSLMALPPPGMTLEDKRALNRELLRSGATIVEMNTVRKHLSGIKGGRLAAAAHPARVVTLVISDIPGDDPALIASGPTLPDSTSAEDAKEIVSRYRLNLTPSAWAALDGCLQTVQVNNVDVQIIAAPSLALAAASEAARSVGLTPLVLGDAIEGESRELGVVMAGIARSVRSHGMPVVAPAVLLSGGETTVTIGRDATGRGGRNTEFLLGLAIGLSGAAGIWAIAGDTDGIGGTEDAAGALVCPDTLCRGRGAGLNARGLLASHDSYTFFEALGDLVRTGPTLTNVNDIRAVLIT
jgi:glycerate 2-kinase